MKTISRVTALMAVISVYIFLAANPVEAQPVGVFFNDLAGFDSAAGSPPVVISFDDITVGTDITGATLSSVTFDLGNQPPPSPALIVVRGVDTFTPGGFSGAPNPETNKLFPTSGANVLSPGGAQLAPGFNPLLENDDLKLTFDPPVSAVGFDILYQSLDCCSYVGITVSAPGGGILYSNSMIPSGASGGGGQPGGSEFVGFVSSSANIATIVINEFDDNNIFPDANIGYDSFRFEPPVIPVDIDIKPGSDPNCINPDGNGVIPVAILTTETFDATTVDPATVYLDGSGVAVRGKSDKMLAAIEDVDRDGDLDLVVKIVDNTLLAGQDVATLTGWTSYGAQIEGTDFICIVPPADS